MSIEQITKLNPDILVVGGGIAGVFAAVNAARKGEALRTPIIELAAGEHHHNGEHGQAHGEHDLGLGVRPSGVFQTRSEHGPGVDRA